MIKDHEDEFSWALDRAVDRAQKPSTFVELDPRLKSGIKSGELMLICGGFNKGRSRISEMMSSKALAESNSAWLAMPFPELPEEPVEFAHQEPVEKPAEQEVVYIYPRKHRTILNAVVLLPKTSRNQREGRYNFKVKGRHTRKRSKDWHKVIQIEMSKKFHDLLNGVQND
jgi:hypothetical protein